MKSISKGRVILSLICILLLIPSISYAHAMFLKLEEPGVLRVEYDGGGFSSRTEVTIYDKEGNELGKGLVDEEGKFHFDPDLEVHSAVADDGMGHRVEYKVGVKEKTVPKVPAIIGVFAVIGIITVIYNKRAKQKQPQ
ncbi:MAG TPA: hypothetical protein GX723_08195 [Thermoanaerobacterales bacterium]|jgi:nickel transport protein|nr:hypothetical protein [Thermoanaerobacterales bacterium]